MKVDIEGLGGVLTQLNIIRSPALRKRILRKAGRNAVKASKKHITDQTDLDGNAFKARADGRKRKMLTRKVRKLIKELETTNLDTTVGYKNPVIGRIAFKQQHGFSETVNKRTVKDRKRVKSTDPATRKQAIELRNAGYKKKRARGPGKHRPTIKWVTENLTVGQASAILHTLRVVKESWKTTIPGRSFLGVTNSEIKLISELIQTEIDLSLRKKNQR